MAQIIFLHGASSSGKSTIARALQKEIEASFWHISIDHLRDSDVLPIARYQSGEFSWSAHRSAIFDGFHRSVAAYADAGNNLIVEHILDTEGWAEDLRELLRYDDVLFVGIRCRVQVLNKREAARGNRPLGSAERDEKSIHEGRRYDLVINSADELEPNVTAILAAWRGEARRSEFHLPSA